MKPNKPVFIADKRGQISRAVALSVVLAATFVGHSLSAADAAPADPLRDLDRYALTYAHPGSQLKDFIYERTRRLFAFGDAQRDALRTPESVARRQLEIRRDVIAGMGGLPPTESPLNARVTGTVQGRDFTIENIIFEARPHHYVTANLYLPARRTGRTGAVLFLCGHHVPAKQQPEYQNVCQTLVQAGLVVLAQDPVGQGERLSYYDPVTQKPYVPATTRDHDMAGAQCRFLGEGLSRYFLHDAMRGIDYLISRPEVDPKRIGVTGNSGGGTQTSFMMLADPRIAAAAPGTFIMSRDTYQRTGEPQDAEQIWSGFTSGGYDHEDILQAMAPKPVCVLAVTYDFFPIEGTRHTVARSRRIWELFGRGSALELVEDQSKHAYTPKLARAAARFFTKHLLDRDVDLAGFEPKPFPMEKLQCTKSGQVRADFSDAEFIFDATGVRARQAADERGKMALTERKARAGAWLRSAVFRDREKNELNVRRIDRGRKVGEFEVDTAFWWSQPNLANLGMLIRLPEMKGKLPVTVAIWNEGTAAISEHAAWIRTECGGGRAVFVVNLSGMGPLRPDPINMFPVRELYGTWHKLSDDLDWIGDSLVALRTFEATRLPDVLAEWSELARDDLRFYADGRVGVHAKLAAAIEPRVPRCEWTNGFAFADFLRNRVYDYNDVKPFILPGVLRVLDIDEL